MELRKLAAGLRSKDLAVRISMDEAVHGGEGQFENALQRAFHIDAQLSPPVLFAAPFVIDKPSSSSESKDAKPASREGKDGKRQSKSDGKESSEPQQGQRGIIVWEESVEFSCRLKVWAEVVKVWSIDCDVRVEQEPGSSVWAPDPHDLRVRAVAKRVFASHVLGRSSTLRRVLRPIASGAATNDVKRSSKLAAPKNYLEQKSVDETPVLVDQGQGDRVWFPSAHLSGDGPTILKLFRLALLLQLWCDVLAAGYPTSSSGRA